MIGPGSPPPATDTVLSLVSLLADPVRARETIQAYNDARVSAEAAVQAAAVASSENVEKTAILAHREAEIARVEAELRARSKHAEEFSSSLEQSRAEHESAVRAHESAVRASNSDISKRASDVGRREQSVADLEAAVAAAHESAAALKFKYERMIARLQEATNEH